MRLDLLWRSRVRCWQKARPASSPGLERQLTVTKSEEASTNPRTHVDDDELRLQAAAANQIWCFSTTLFCAPGLNETFVPSGSGTFVLVNGKPALLTAAHVWERIRGDDLRKQVSFAIGNGHEAVTMNTLVLSELYRSPRPKKWTAEGPDIALVGIPDRDAARLRAAGKAFYDLSKRRAEPAPRDEKTGAWVVVGAPATWMETTGLRRPDGAQSISADLTVLSRADIRGGSLQGGFDYCDLWLGSGGVLTSYEGLSGAGLWWVGDRLDSERLTWDGSAVTLTGVAYYHSADDPEGQFLRCHGHASIYGRVLNALGA